MHAHEKTPYETINISFFNGLLESNSWYAFMYKFNFRNTNRCRVRTQYLSSCTKIWLRIPSTGWREPTTTMRYRGRNKPNGVRSLVIVTARQRSCGKVMFSQVCVILSTGWGWVGMHGSRSLLGVGVMPGSRSVLGGVVMSGPKPLLRGGGYAWSQVPSWSWVNLEGTPPERYNPQEGTSTRRYNPGKVRTPEGTPLVPTSSGSHRIGRYLSYWNAFLFYYGCLREILKVQSEFSVQSKTKKKLSSATIPNHPQTSQKWLLFLQGELPPY